MSTNTIVRPEELDRLLYEPGIGNGGDERTAFDYLAVLWRRKLLFLAVLLTCIVLGVLAFVTRKKMYESTALLLVVSKSSSGGASGRSAGDLLNQVDALTGAATVDTQVEVIQSPEVIADAYRRVPLLAREAGFGKSTNPEAVPGGALKVEADKDTDVIGISARSYSPLTSALFANAVAQSYLTRDRERSSQAARQARQFVEGRLQQAGVDYERATRALSAYQRQTGLIDADTQLQDAAHKIADLESNIEKARADRAVAEKSYAVLNGELRQQRPTIDFSKTVAENPEYSSTRDELLKAKDTLHTDEQEYGPNSLRIEGDKQKIATLEKSLAGVAKQYVRDYSTQHNPNIDKVVGDLVNQNVQAQSLGQQIAADSSALSRRKLDIQRFPEGQQHLAMLQQKVDVQNRIYNSLSDKYYDLIVAEKSVLPNGFIISAATPSVKPASPTPSLFAGLFGFVGIVFGILAVLIAEYRDKRVRDPNYIESHYGILTLTAVPRVAELSRGGGAQYALMGRVKKNAAFVEAYRYLRNNILLTMGAHGAHVLAVTSPGSGDGKTTTSINLAISLGLDGKRVVIVEGDLRRPSLHQWHGTAGAAGFTDVVLGSVPLSSAVVETPYQNVSLLTAGKIPENPPELLNSEASRSLIKTLSQQYDYVIIDCPPAAGVSDVQVIATIADGVLLVVAMEQSTSPYIKASIRTLRQAGAKLLGTVINQVSAKDATAAPYYYVAYGEDHRRALGESS